MGVTIDKQTEQHGDVYILAAAHDIARYQKNSGKIGLIRMQYYSFYPGNEAKKIMADTNKGKGKNKNGGKILKLTNLEQVWLLDGFITEDPFWADMALFRFRIHGFVNEEDHAQFLADYPEAHLHYQDNTYI